jgi:thioredoxin 1
MSQNHLVHLDAGNFEEEVLKSAVPVLVDFWAPWCPPCRRVSPLVEELSSEYVGRIKVGKLNTDDYPEIAGRYRISSIPAFLLYDGGQVRNMIFGAVPKSELRSFLESALPKGPMQA